MSLDQAQIDKLLNEVKSDLQLPSSFPGENLTQKIKEGEYYLNSLVIGVGAIDIDFVNDLNARSLLKEYTRHSYFGVLDEFKKKYEGEIIDTQIKRLQPTT